MRAVSELTYTSNVYVICITKLFFEKDQTTVFSVVGLQDDVSIALAFQCHRYIIMFTRFLFSIV